MLRRFLLAGVGAVAVGAVACGSSTGPSTKWGDPTTISYYPGLHVNLSRMTKTASGVFYWDSIAGSGTVPVGRGDQVTTRYTLWLPDGTLVESGNYGPFTLSAGNVIDGWVDGLPGAVQGTTRQLVIPPALAYKAAGQGKIPRNATLVFLVTVTNVVPAADVAKVDRIAGALVAAGIGSAQR